MALTMSHVAGPTTPAVREWTFGDLLRRAAESAPDRLALIAGVPDPALRRKWTYAELYREAQRINGELHPEPVAPVDERASARKLVRDPKTGVYRPK